MALNVFYLNLNINLLTSFTCMTKSFYDGLKCVYPPPPLHY